MKEIAHRLRQSGLLPQQRLLQVPNLLQLIVGCGQTRELVHEHGEAFDANVSE